MKIFIVGFALLAATACAQLSPSGEYLPPGLETAIAPSNEYLAPAEQADVTILGDDGYRYKAVRRLRTQRKRRDVSELPSVEYLPPQHGEEIAFGPAEEEQTILGDDGYRYKAVHRRLRTQRKRRDVSELPSAEYLPPQHEVAFAAPSNEYLAPIAAAEEEHTILGDDGYRYKAVRRLRTQRKRRDVSELPSAEYLPPQHEVAFAAPSNEYLAPVATAEEEHTILGDDGYRYKAVHRRLRTQRKRRDVSELPSAEYLPPQHELGFAAPSNEYLAPAVAAEEEHTILGDDGYRYKAVRRLRTQRKRRDVSELPSAEYLPPQHGEEIAFAAFGAGAEEEQTILGDDGYRYKAVHRRLRTQRKRRDVNELPSAEYLPPQQQHEEIAYAPSNEYLAPALAAATAVEPHTILADDGYRYKSVRKLKFRRH